MSCWTVIGWAALGLLACLGAVQALSWVVVRLCRKGGKVYRVVPVGGVGSRPGDQMSLACACVQWESNPSGQRTVLYDAGLGEGEADACARLARALDAPFVRSPGGLAALLAEAGSPEP